MTKQSFLEKLLKGEPVVWKKLGDVATLKRGKTIISKNKTKGEIPVISGGQKPAYYHGEYNCKGETITVAGSGAYSGHLMFWNIPIFVSDAFSIKPDLETLTIKFVFYFLFSNQVYIVYKKALEFPTYILKI